MFKSHLLMASAVLALVLTATSAIALPPGYNRNLARQQLANATIEAHRRGLVNTEASQNMGSRLATNTRFVVDHVTELQREGVVLGTAQLGTSGGRVLDAILAAETAASAGRNGVSTSVTGSQTAKPGTSTPATRDTINNISTGAQSGITATRGVAPTLTSRTETTKTPGRNTSMISDVDNPGFWDWVRTGGDSSQMDKEWNQKYGSKPACGDDGDVMCGYRFTGGGASNGGAGKPNPDGTARPDPATLNVTPGSLTNPRNGSHVTNPAPDSTTGGTAGMDRTAPIPTLPGGGVGNPGSPDNVRAPIKIDTKPIISNTNVINPDRSNGAPTDPSQPGTGAQGSVGTPGSKKTSD